MSTPPPCRICQEYELFKSRALSVPEDAREMMDLIGYMEGVKGGVVRELWEAVQDSLRRLSFLLDVHSFSPEEMGVNQNTLTWPQRLSPIFEESEEVSPSQTLV